jgi:hypothetical protein
VDGGARQAIPSGISPCLHRPVPRRRRKRSSLTQPGGSAPRAGRKAAHVPRNLALVTSHGFPGSRSACGVHLVRQPQTRWIPGSLDLAAPRSPLWDHPARGGSAHPPAASPALTAEAPCRPDPARIGRGAGSKQPLDRRSLPGNRRRARSPGHGADSGRSAGGRSPGVPTRPESG